MRRRNSRGPIRSSSAAIKSAGPPSVFSQPSSFSRSAPTSRMPSPSWQLTIFCSCCGAIIGRPKTIAPTSCSLASAVAIISEARVFGNSRARSRTLARASRMRGELGPRRARRQMQRLERLGIREIRVTDRKANRGELKMRCEAENRLRWRQPREQRLGRDHALARAFSSGFTWGQQGGFAAVAAECGASTLLSRSACNRARSP